MSGGGVDLAFIGKEECLAPDDVEDRAVAQDDARCAGMNAEQDEAPVGVLLKRRFPVRADRLLAFQRAAGFAGDRNDERRRHREVVGVVRENAIKVFRIPCADPLVGKPLGEVGGEHGNKVTRDAAA